LACGGPRAAAAARPSIAIAPVALPKANPEAQAAFDEGVNVMKLGRKHYKEARQSFTKATTLDGKLFEAWHDLGVIETALGITTKPSRTSRRPSTFSRALARPCWPMAKACGAPAGRQKAAKVYAKWLDFGSQRCRDAVEVWASPT